MRFYIDVLVTTQKGKPVAMLKALDDDSHVKTRVCQYEAISNGKGMVIVKQIVKAKIEGQNQVLRKYGLKPLDLNKSEGHNARLYFSQIFKLFPESLRPKRRIGFKAYDGINNLFNLGYEVLSWKVHKALVNAKLEPYLGFLHTVKFGMPSLVCDLMEIYRFLIDDFLIQHYSKINEKSLVTKYETLSKNKIGKREYLNDYDFKELTRQLNLFFESVINIPRIRHGKKQTLDTLISEEALLLAKFLRNERVEWCPRVTFLIKLI